MTRRLLLSYLAVTAVVLLLLEVPLGLFYAQRETERLTAEVDHDATVLATLYEDALEQATPLDPRAAQSYQRRTGARVVVVDAGGISQVDTDQDTPRDFSTRPEIAEALLGRRASGTRRSETLDAYLLYVAVPVASGGNVHGALRVTLDTGHVNRHIQRFWIGLALVAVLVMAVMALIGWILARSVTRPVRQLQAAAARFAAGDLRVGDAVAAEGPPELRDLAASMTTMAEQLSKLLDDQRAFVADASHQLRTPLTALRLRLENLQHASSSADRGELDATIEETERLSALVNDLLQLARADRRRDPVVVDLAAIVTDRVDTWSAVAEQRSIRLRRGDAERSAAVLAVPGAVEQVFDNVLDNALLYSPAGSAVEVRVERAAARTPRDPGVIRLIIADEGPGLSEADRERALRRFWRAEHTTPGSGLGLAIAQALTAASGGRLELSAGHPHGLTVTASFPAAPAAPALPAEQAGRPGGDAEHPAAEHSASERSAPADRN